MSRDRSNDGPKSAAELMAELQHDPEYVAKAQQQERQQHDNAEKYSRAVAPLLEELASKGVWVNTIGELRTRDVAEYRAAVPILLRWLPQVSAENIKEDIVRTLSIPWAKPTAGPILLEEFKKADNEGLRWAIGNGLAVAADDSLFEAIVELVEDRRYGKAREMLAVALGNMRDPRATDVLLDLLDDSDMVGHAVMALGHLRAAVARKRIASLVTHPKQWVREEAKKALAAIEQAL